MDTGHSVLLINILMDDGLGVDVREPAEQLLEHHPRCPLGQPPVVAHWRRCPEPLSFDQATSKFTSLSPHSRAFFRYLAVEATPKKNLFGSLLGVGLGSQNSPKFSWSGLNGRGKTSMMPCSLLSPISKLVSLPRRTLSDKLPTGKNFYHKELKDSKFNDDELEFRFDIGVIFYQKPTAMRF